MKDIKWLIDKYLTFLKENQETSKRLIVALQKDDCLDEANLEKVRLNVVDIFYKMFNISISDDSIALNEKYLGFFNKISEPWYKNKEKAMECGKEKEMIVENIKIEKVEELKNKFNDYYNQLDGN